MNRSWSKCGEDSLQHKQETLAAFLTDVVGMVPHVVPLFEAVGLFGLEPRVRQLAALAVARSGGCSAVVARHQLIGKAAGLTTAELEGSFDGLTAAELSAVVLALGTVSRPIAPDIADPFDSADHHFTSAEIRQVQAVALAVDIDCKFTKRATDFAKRLIGHH